MFVIYAPLVLIYRATCTSDHMTVTSRSHAQPQNILFYLFIFV